jgi:hypothetical protein
MELTVKSRNVILHNGAIATSALGCEHVEVVVAAIWFSIAFVEAIVAELLTALSAEEVLSMPGLVQCCYAFLHKQKDKISYTKSHSVYNNLHPKLVHCNKRSVD